MRTYQPNPQPEQRFFCGRACATNTASPGTHHRLPALRPRDSFYLAKAGTAGASARRYGEEGSGRHAVPGVNEEVGLVKAWLTLNGGCGWTSVAPKEVYPPAACLRVVFLPQGGHDPGALTSAYAAATGRRRPPPPPLPRGLPNAPARSANLPCYTPFYAGSVFDSTLGYPGECETA